MGYYICMGCDILCEGVNQTIGCYKHMGRYYSAPMVWSFCSIIMAYVQGILMHQQ